ncbi:MAG: hypothetical protein MZV63_07120 [Marinilabiliales bacterium]|nr:hypothetical protein [Marinilabiliales bacterium]
MFRHSNNGLLRTAKITFEIPTVAEVGRITISTFDEEGRISVVELRPRLIALFGCQRDQPGGKPVRACRGGGACVVEEAVSGGVLTVRGDVWPFNLQPGHPGVDRSRRELHWLADPDGRDDQSAIVRNDHSVQSV